MLVIVVASLLVPVAAIAGCLAGWYGTGFIINLISKEYKCQ